MRLLAVCVVIVMAVVAHCWYWSRRFSRETYVAMYGEGEPDEVATSEDNAPV